MIFLNRGEIMTITFTIPREPQGKARPRVVRNKYTGKVSTYIPDKTVAYEELVRLKYTEATNHKFVNGESLEIKISAYFKIPRGKSKKNKLDMQLHKILPTKKPDCDNISKIVCDALNGVAYKDDAQIVS